MKEIGIKALETCWQGESNQGRSRENVYLFIKKIGIKALEYCRQGV